MSSHTFSHAVHISFNFHISIFYLFSSYILNYTATLFIIKVVHFMSDPEQQKFFPFQHPPHFNFITASDSQPTYMAPKINHPEDCIVCMDDLAGSVSPLHCDHAFRTECLFQWQRSSSACSSGSANNDEPAIDIRIAHR